MSIQDNKALILRWFAANFPSDVTSKSNEGKDRKAIIEKTTRATVEELFTPDFTINFSGGRGDREYVIQLNTELALAFPDTVFNVDKMVSEGDLVAFFGRSRGTHLGPFRGVPATGKTIEYHFMAMVRIADGKIAQEWIFFDPSDFKQLFGIVLPPK